MPEARQEIVRVLLHSAVAEWITTLGLIFGGCCSNAWALELATSQNPHAGTLITFAQFLLVSLYGLGKHLTVARIPTERKELLRLATSSILLLRAQKRTAEQVYVAIEGPRSASSAFTEELAYKVKTTAPQLSLKHFAYAGDAPDISSRLDTLWGPDVLEESDTVVLVDGHHLHTPELRGRWDYSIFLVSSEKNSGEDFPSLRTIHSSLTVDVTTPTHPIIISPVTTRLTPWNLLNALPRIRLKKLSIPISRWALQVALFLLTSLLNNAAFGYNVPMAVHIIFRSGGLVVNMIMGWLIDGRRYNATQIISVVVVTLGVAFTTLSASQPSPGRVSTSTTSSGSYAVGILILTLALVMSGFMGLAQDRTYAQYGRGHWQEAMFYLHFLALPGFALLWRDLGSQLQTVNASARIEIGLDTFAIPFQTLVKTANVSVTYPPGMRTPYSTILPYLAVRRVSIPSFYFPLLLNVATQLLCVSGVHRLTSRVNSLTVTLVLVVRKAVSLVISVVVLRKGRGGGLWLWAGAALVLAGTIGYTVGGGRKQSEGDGGRDSKKER